MSYMKQNLQGLIDITITDTVASHVSGCMLTHPLCERYNIKNFQTAILWRFQKYTNEVIHNTTLTILLFCREKPINK